MRQDIRAIIDAPALWKEIYKKTFLKVGDKKIAAQYANKRLGMPNAGGVRKQSIIAVLAGSDAEFDDLCGEIVSAHGSYRWKPSREIVASGNKWINITVVDQLLGLPNFEVLRFGSWEKRFDPQAVEEIEQAARFSSRRL